MNEDALYKIALEIAPGVGNLGSKLLIAHTGSAKAVFEAKATQLLKIPRIGKKTVGSLQDPEVLKRAEKILSDCEKFDIRIVHLHDADYPDRLKQIPDSPNLLYVRGKGSLAYERSMSIVGTRQATEYGLSITEEIAKSSVDFEAIMISGLAYGVDICAHKASLKAGIPNIAVLAGGLDIIYPSAHMSVAEQIMETGVLISENPPQTKPDAHFFPARNRIIAGLSDVVVVTEAAAKGGALITAEIAFSYDRPLFAVPGNLKKTYSEGCNLLISKQKAIIYTSPKDIAYHLNWDLEGIVKVKKPKQPSFDHLNEEEQIICNTLMTAPSGMAIDDLSWKTQISLNKLAGILLNLEFQGIIKGLPGKKFKIKD